MITMMVKITATAICLSQLKDNKMKHTIKFASIQEMLLWIVENDFYEVIPVDLTIQLGE